MNNGVKRYASEKYVNEKVVQSDYNQNDSTALDFVKNRPFYVSDNLIDVLVFETNLSEQNVVGFYDNIASYYLNNIEFKPLIENNTYVVTLDGESIEVVCKKSNSFTILELGNAKDGSVTGYNFGINMNYENPTYLMVTIYNTTSTSHTLQITTKENEIVKLDEKFLPDTIRYQSDWDQDNPDAADYIKNRTHYIEKDSLVLDEVELYKDAYVVGHDHFTPEVGQIYHITWDEVSYECECKQFGNYFRYVGNLKHYNGLYTSYVENPIDTGEPFCFNFEGYYGVTFSHSLYSVDGAQHTITIDEFLTEEVKVTRSFDIPIVDGETYEIIWDGVTYNLEAIDINGIICLGNTELENYANTSISEMPGTGEPFCIKSSGIIVAIEGEHTYSIKNITPERTVRFRAVSYYGGIQYNLNVNFELEKIYKVLFDNVEYELQCNQNDGNTTLGNPNMGYMIDQDIQVPFLINVDENSIYLYPGQHTLKIFEDKYHPIDKNYLPPLVGKISEGGGEIFNHYFNNIATGEYSHAEGCYTTASGDYSHAEGGWTEASGYCSHAEGSNTEASGYYSHAEGGNTQATGKYSHAEGSYTSAYGLCSHVEGNQTEAYGNYQHVQGRFNIHDVDADGNALNTYLHIVGNGSGHNNRSNAHTLDWDGNAWYQGSVETTAIILKSPNGTRFNITIGDDGVLKADEITV